MDRTSRKKRRLACVEDADADFVRLGRGDLDLLDLEGFACGPADGSLASDDLSSGIGHGMEREGREEKDGIGARRGFIFVILLEDPVHTLIVSDRLISCALVVRVHG